MKCDFIYNAYNAYIDTEWNNKLSVESLVALMQPFLEHIYKEGRTTVCCTDWSCTLLVQWEDGSLNIIFLSVCSTEQWYSKFKQIY